MVGRSLSVRHIHIDPDAGYDMALIRWIPGQLQQDPADLAPVHTRRSATSARREAIPFRAMFA